MGGMLREWYATVLVVQYGMTVRSLSRPSRALCSRPSRAVRKELISFSAASRAAPRTRGNTRALSALRFEFALATAVVSAALWAVVPEEASTSAPRSWSSRVAAVSAFVYCRRPSRRPPLAYAAEDIVRAGLIAAPASTDCRVQARSSEQQWVHEKRA